ncbi:hypothetical protein AA958_17280 [Streptomyces sp. CNQ-509]|nr:hypothetical protein AA958_17280 [Streptomyces sp. CNQ-509]
MTCPTAPHIVFVMTDQFRADFTAGEGFGLDTMPFLDSLAAGGMRFRRACGTTGTSSTSTWTGRRSCTTSRRTRWSCTTAGTTRACATSGRI